MSSPARPSLIQEIMTGTLTAEQLTAGTSVVISSLIRIGMIILVSFLVMRVVSRLIDRLFKSREDEQRVLFQPYTRGSSQRHPLQADEQRDRQGADQPAQEHAAAGARHLGRRGQFSDQASQHRLFIHPPVDRLWHRQAHPPDAGHQPGHQRRQRSPRPLS